MEFSESGQQRIGDSPLLSHSPRVWDDLIQAIGPASLILAIESRLGQSLRRSHSADDILQEALLHAWNSRASCEWRGVKAFRAWLLTIIDHRIHDAADWQGALKRGGNLRGYSLDAALASNGHHSEGAHLTMPAALIDSTTPSRLVVYREQAAAMQAAMNELPEDVRDVIRLRLVEQLTLETIAQVLGLGVAAVRHRFRKGAELYRTRLRSSLSGFSHHRSVHPRDSAPPGRPSSAQD